MLVTFSALVVVVAVVAVATVVASSHASVLIKIISGLIRVYSSKKQLGATGLDWTSSNEIVNYLSYSRHAGFPVSWKIHVTCSIRTEKKNVYSTAVASSWVLSFLNLRHYYLYSIFEIYLKRSDEKVWD